MPRSWHAQMNENVEVSSRMLNLFTISRGFISIVSYFDIDNDTDGFIMKSVIGNICLMRCKGVSAEELYKKEDLMN